MLKRPLVTAALVFSTALAAVGLSARQAEAQAARVTFGRATITPRRVSGGGGSVNIRLRITVRNTRIRSVLGRARVSGARVTTLRNEGSGNYSGAIVVPGNRSSEAVTREIV